MNKLQHRLNITPISKRTVEWMAGEQLRRTQKRRAGQIARALKGKKVRKYD